MRRLIRLAPEKLVDPGDVALGKIEELLGTDGVSILQRCLSFGEVCLHKLLSGRDVAAQTNSLCVLLSP
jgi:hypothetical protein